MARELLEGSQAVAKAVGLARPGVVCAYPISPQTHIVEAFSANTRTGKLKNCEYVNVESEFAAMSVAIGSSAVGARTYTATASQGLLYMAEAIYNASGLGLPIVMTVANRTIGSPINIWNDHSDSLSQRDSGWLQLFCASNQESVDVHIQAFKIAEELRIPVMVCMDGFVLTHAAEIVDFPTQEQVDGWLPPASEITREIDVDNPRTVGTMAGPEIFTETKFISNQLQLQAAEVIERVSLEWESLVGRSSGGLLRMYERGDDGGFYPFRYISGRTAPATADDVVVIAMGATLGTIQAILPEMDAEGTRIKVIGITSFRPFPDALLAEAVGEAMSVVVLDRAVQLGIGGVLSGETLRALQHKDVHVHPVATGIGGRPVLERSLANLFRRATRGELSTEMEWLDLDTDIVEKAIADDVHPTAEQMAAVARALGRNVTEA
jgi:pyruvate ferredoxin oxidoreductase alpha subunit